MSWVGPKWISSRHNFAPEVLRNLSFPEKMEIYDWTLEGDGELMPGMIFTRKQRLDIARMLDDVGVHNMLAGNMTAASRYEDFNVVREITHLGLTAKIEAFARVNKPDIDFALKSDVSGVQMQAPCSEDWIEQDAQWQSTRNVIDRTTEAVTYAKEHGLHVTICLQEPFRGSENFAKEFIESLERSNVDAISFAERGGAGPEAVKHFVSTVKHWTKLPIATHFHNFLGLATANTLAALSAGASIAGTTVNGIGENNGLTPLDEVVVALRILYNKDVGVKLDKLFELSKVVENATGPIISKLKPVVGEQAHALEIDRYEAFQILPRHARLVRLCYEPDLVGNKFKTFIGKNTGIQGIKREAERLGFRLTDEQAEDPLIKALIRQMSKVNHAAGEADQ